MPRTFLALAFLCLLGPAVADERAAARQQIEAARQTSPNCRSCSSRSSRRNRRPETAADHRKRDGPAGKAGRHPAAGNRPQRGRAGAPERGEDHPRRCSPGTAAPDRPAGPRRLSERSPGIPRCCSISRTRKNSVAPSPITTISTRPASSSSTASTRHCASWPTSRPTSKRSRTCSPRRRTACWSAAISWPKVRERQQALAKLNSDLSSREQRLQARRQEQAQFERVLKTIEETLARQAREAEEARQRELLAERQRQQQQQQARPSGSSAPSGPLVSSAGGSFAGRSPRPKVNCPGRWTDVSSPATALHAAATLETAGRRTDRRQCRHSRSVPCMAAGWYSPTGCAVPACW